MLTRKDAEKITEYETLIRGISLIGGKKFRERVGAKRIGYRGSIGGYGSAGVTRAMQREGERKVGKYGVESKSGRKRKEEFGIVAAATMEMDSVVVGYRVDIPACESAGTASAVSRRARIPIDQFSVRRDLSKPCHFLPPR